MYVAKKDFISKGYNAKCGDKLDIKNKKTADYLIKVGFIEQEKKKAGNDNGTAKKD
jgi:hypothetical protein